MFRKLLWGLISVLLFVGLIFVLSLGLKRDQQQMPSALIDKPLPEFNLTDLYDENKIYNKEALMGKLFLINVWASWCPPCAKEHDVIIQLAEEGYPFVGLNYQDNRGEAQIWLEERGDPYQKVLYDEQGSVGIDWGVIGVPETFIVDAQGLVRFRHIGMLTLDVWNEKFLPMINKLDPPKAQSPYVFSNPQDEKRFFELAGKLRCLVCQNQTLLDSDASLAKNLREQVYEQVIAGKSNQDILNYLTQRYGDFILYEPPVNKSTWLLWFGPALAFAIALIILIIIIRRAHKQHKSEAK